MILALALGIRLGPFALIFQRLANLNRRPDPRLVWIVRL